MYIFFFGGGIIISPFHVLQGEYFIGNPSVLVYRYNNLFEQTIDILC